MDSSISLNPDSDIDVNNTGGFYLEIENNAYPATLKNKTTIIKYTKLPDYDFDSKVCQALKPRLRRIIEIDYPQLQSSRSLQLGAVSVPRMNAATQRKMVSIVENEEDKFTPHIGRVTHSINRSSSTNMKDVSAVQKPTPRITYTNKSRDANSTNRSSRTVSRDDKSPIPKNYLKSSNMDKSSRLKLNVKTNNVTNKKPYVSPKLYSHNKDVIAVSNHALSDNMRNKSTKDKEKSRSTIPPKINLSKNYVIPSESEGLSSIAMKNRSVNNSTTAASKRLPERNLFPAKSPQRNAIVKILNKVPSENPVSVIHVPIDSRRETIARDRNAFEDLASVPVHKSDFGTDMEQQYLKDANVSTSPQPTMVDGETETSNNLPDVFDDLDIPNVTLIKDKSNFAKEELVSFCSRSMPNLKAGPFKLSPEKENSDEPVGSGKTKTYIIGRATFTYTTKQKINIHVVGSSDDSKSNQSPSPLAYPLSVVSLFKKNLDQCEMFESCKGEHLSNKRDKSSCHTNVDELHALACPDVYNNNKLVKPSDLISTIRVNNGLLHNDYISEQFQRELHFIDSFFESLQYLESCSLTEKCFPESSTENWVSKTGFDNSEYNSFLSKLENGAGVLANVDDIETMASKSLCLLNLLIRNEQRRAKNLLFVLKMREDALKDFTKSQIIWLENKKKQDNTDVSTLKKKQRGALLKLQHECGEMQRMRKALLTLSERRKAALMKTRNSIELKLKNNVDVEQILLGKKKLKRSTSADRNIAPLKCFDLSSSGCEESSSSKPKETPVLLQELQAANSCAEKCVQTGDSICEPAELVTRSTDTAAENFVAVDGGYLNILFQNLALPHIFSSGKQYEVNEEALRNIVQSSNQSLPKYHCESDFLENFMDKIRSRDSDRSSSASTAHSLVDEFDQYYKGLSDRSKSPADSPDFENQNNVTQHIPQAQVFESSVQTTYDKLDQSEKYCSVASETEATEIVNPVISSDTLVACVCESSNNPSFELLMTNDDVPVPPSQAGPLPVPPGAATPELDSLSPMSVTTFNPSLGSSTRSELETTTSSTCSMAVTSTALAHSEAEELRRQQLAVEREIKALEQQQNQLLVVREIPDKPPPPYTPPSNTVAKTSRMFTLNDDIEDKISRHVTHGEEFTYDPCDPFSVFIKDICEESLARQRLQLSDEPWDSCNLLPHNHEPSPEKRAQNTICEVQHVLSCIPPTVISGVGSRRSDHIDDILFGEWRRCEPEWTNLHTDEAVVKAQVFESLFQKVLSETVDQYKQTVLGLIITPSISEKPFRKKNQPSKLGKY